MFDRPLPRRGVKDAGAARALYDLVARAADRFKVFGPVDVLVASAPHKFNDYSTDDQWYAVHIGESYWEQAQYFSGASERVTEPAPPPVIEERSRIKGDVTVDDIVTDASEAASGHIALARVILHDLEKAGWRAPADQALEGQYDTVLSLATQHGQVWLCRHCPIEDNGDAWLCTPDLHFVHFARCCRLDDEIGNAGPIYFGQVHPDALPYMTVEAQQYFAPEIRDGAAYRDLSALVDMAAREAAAVTDQPLTFASRRSRSGFWGGGRVGTADQPGGHLSWQGIWTRPVKPGMACKHWRTGKMEPCPEEIHRLSPILESLEGAKWRDLFGKAYGVPLIGRQQLALFVGPSHAVLARENSRFRIADGTLTFAGIGDYPNCGKPEDLA